MRVEAAEGQLVVGFVFLAMFGTGEVFWQIVYGMVYKFDKSDCSVDGHDVWAGGSDKDFIWCGGGGSSALRQGRSACTGASGSPNIMTSTRTFRALSCLQVYTLLKLWSDDHQSVEHD